MFILETKSGAKLKPFEASEAALLFKLIDQNRGHLRTWLGWLDYSRNEADTLNFIESSIKDLNAGKSMVFGVWIEGNLAGVVSFNEFNWPNKRGAIGYWLSHSSTKKGHMSLAVLELVHLGFSKLKLNTIEIRCATGNSPSRNIAERLGFVHVGTFPQAEWLYDHFVDHEIYVLTHGKYLLTHGAT